MDIFSNLTAVVLRQESAYAAGIIAAFTPCILAIIPVFLYRFGIWESKPSAANKQNSMKKTLRELGLFIVGFFTSFIVTGLLLNQLSNSAYVNATRLTLSFILILVAILQLFHRINIYFHNRFTNPLVLGLATPFIVSLSPCVLPYFSLVLANQDIATILPKFVLFGLGILTPPIITALLGKFALNLFRKSSGLFAKIEKWAPILILISGIYLGTQLIEVTQQDVIISGVITLVIILFSIYKTFEIHEQRTYQNMRNYIIVIAIWSAVVLFLLAIAPQASSLTHDKLINYCMTNNMGQACEVCNQAEILFSLLAIVLGITIIRSSNKGDLVKLTY